jgi:probable HAF family extracellular repeat protein
MRTRTAVRWATAVSMLAASAAWAANTSFVGVGALTGTNYYSQAMGISGDGSTVVGQSRVPGGAHAFVWTRAGGLVGVPDLPGGATEGLFFGASYDGSVAVGYGTRSLNLDEATEAVRWTKDGGHVGLGDFPGGHFRSRAFGVSGDGQVVVGEGTGGGFADHGAFRWTAGGGMVSLGALGGFNARSSAFDTNADGSVVVGSSTWTVGDPGGAFRWTQATGMTALPSAPGLANTVEANSISPDGQYIIGTGMSLQGRHRTILWTPSGPTLLGTLANAVQDYGQDLSADGSVLVGNYRNTSAVDRAYIWTTEHGMRDMRTAFMEMGLMLPGWTLTRVHGISDDGLTIVGEGINPNGHNEGWVAVIPSPGSALIVVAGLWGAGARRRRPD